MKNLQFTKKELDEVLHDEQFTPEKLIEFLSVDLGEVYDADAGVWEKYTIGEHTIMMMRQFERYFCDKKLPADFDLGIFRLILALHDTGKPEAITRGDKSKQHIYTIQMIKYIFESLIISERYKNIAIALIAEDSLGEYIRGNKDVNITAQTINRSAICTEISTKDFFELLTIFYRCDAGSYTQDAGGFKSLDHLFVFDRKKSVLLFAPDILSKVQKLKNALTL